MLETLLTKLQACNFIKKRLKHRCLPLNFAKLFKNTWKNMRERWFCFALCGAILDMNEEKLNDPISFVKVLKSQKIQM